MKLAPLIITKVIWSVIVQRQTINVSPYLDDWLFKGQSLAEIEDSTHKAIHIVEQLGYLVNYKTIRFGFRQSQNISGNGFGHADVPHPPRVEMTTEKLRCTVSIKVALLEIKD